MTRGVSRTAMLAALTMTTVLVGSDERVELRVAWRVGSTLYLDAGGGAGLAEGDQVVFPGSDGDRLAVVKEVTQQTARAEALDPARVPEAGATGHVILPANRAPPAAPAAEAPDHPPWTRPPETRTSEQPLLAPAFGMRGEDRPSRLTGRTYLSYRHSRTAEGDADADYGNLRAGLDADWINPFHFGGRLQMDGEYALRNVSIDGGGEDGNVSHFRIDRLAYLWGDERTSRARIHAGRFLSTIVPELGARDGAEVSVVTPFGGRIGASFGALPVPDWTMKSRDDMAAACFYRQGWNDEKIAATVAYQHGWHKGDNDRDLVLGKVEVAPHRDWRFVTTAWVDAYTSADDIKSPGLELTQLEAYAHWQFHRHHSVGASLSHLTWPELIREEFEPVSADLIEHGERDRIRAFTRHTLSRYVRLNTAVWGWQDEDDNGGGGEVGAATPDLLWQGGECRIDLLYSNSAIVDGPGTRLSVSHTGRIWYGTLSYEYLDQEFDVDAGNGESTVNQNVTAAVELNLSARWLVGGYCELYFGEDQDGQAVQLNVQYRF